MRYAVSIALISLLAGCATTRSITPHEYLDEQTAATITVVADPVIFVAAAPSEQIQPASPSLRFDQASHGQDYFGLYGVDVNRMGTHRQYLAVQKWTAPSTSNGLPTLILRIGTDTLELQATADDARKLGVAQPLADSYSKGSLWWYFPTDTTTLRRIAGAPDLSATLAVADERLDYTVFSDGRAQLGELAQTLR